MLRVSVELRGGTVAVLGIVERDGGDLASYDVELLDDRGTTRARVELFDRTRGPVALVTEALAAVAEARR